jgi:hypothetical protein
MISILVTSQSKLKVDTVASIFPLDKYSITTVDCTACNLPAQPVDCAEYCAKQRLNYAKDMHSRQFDYIISIENGICNNKEECHVLIEHKGLLVHSAGKISLAIPKSALEELCTYPKNNYNSKINGYDITIGDILHKHDQNINPKDWITTIYRVNRSDQIKSSIELAMAILNKNLQSVRELISKYKTYTDYPKAGVVFQDFFSIIREASDIQLLMKLLVDKYRFDQVDYIAGPESRGFFGFGLSVMGKYGFIPVRKQGKLPGNVETINYTTEYSSDTLEIQTDIPIGSKVVNI